MLVGIEVVVITWLHQWRLGELQQSTLTVNVLHGGQQILSLC